jgi:hypothetical protein
MNPQASAIGITLSASPVFFPDVVYFAKVDGTGDLYSQNGILASNFSAQGTFYLLNASPGRYIAVACAKFGQQNWKKPMEVTFFSMAFITQTETTAGSGEMRFLGNYTIKYPFFPLLYHSADYAQRHYFELLVPDTSIVFWSSIWRYFLLGQRELSGDLGKLDHSAQAERHFLELANEQLKPGKNLESDWSDIIRQRLAVLGGAQ